METREFYQKSKLLSARTSISLGESWKKCVFVANVSDCYRFVDKQMAVRRANEKKQLVQSKCEKILLERKQRDSMVGISKLNISFRR